MSQSKRTGHYVVSTHWDREWYQSFQGYRHRLVKLMDELLDTMQREPAFRYFQLDGQAIPIEDYLELRPERQEQIRALAREGRLRIGPWYVLPDEFLVSGESIIRNLQMGMRIASEYGTPSRVGFACDLFGHISQLPQILRGFDIDNAFIWRGVNETTHGAMFRWQSPEGSEVLVYRFSLQGGYCSYAFKIRKGWEPDCPFDFETAMQGMRELLDIETKRCPTPSFLVFDGGDHMEIEPRTVELLKRTNEQFKNVEIIHSHLEGFVEDLREQQAAITRVFVGELRDPAQVGDETWLIPGVLSSRIHLKQANARCETELCRWAEPFSVFAGTLGMAYPRQYLDLAWKYLIRNHPHDSMCGCSIDQVHKDMEYRFDQSMELASIVSREALAYIADRINVPQLGEKDFAVVVFNPSADVIDGPVDLTLRFPAGVDAVFQEWFGFEAKIGFRLFDPEGKQVPYQYVNQRRNRQGFRRVPRKFPLPDPRHEVDITARLHVPAHGYTTLVCRPVKEPTRYLGSMLVDDHTLENEYLCVSVNPNGTLMLTDKRSEQTYDGLLTLENRADIGDGWYHGTAVNEQVYSSVAARADVAVVADGIGKATLMIRLRLDLPEKFEFGDRMERSDSLKPLLITHYVTLRHGSDQLEIRTLVENTLRDHRLRVLMPSGAEASTYLAEQAFDVMERPIALRADNAAYKEMEVETKPQQSWTAVHDNRRGLAVVSVGLPESAVRDLPERPIALTLLRSFTRTVFTSGEEGGEIQGRHEFNYCIIPCRGTPDVARLCRLGQRLAAGIRTMQIEPRDMALEPPGRRELPLSHSFMSLSPPQVVPSAVYQAGKAPTVTVRLFNPTERTFDAAVRIDGLTGTVSLSNLEGKTTEPARQGASGHIVSIKPKQICTLQIAAE